MLDLICFNPDLHEYESTGLVSSVDRRSLPEGPLYFDFRYLRMRS